MRWGKSAMIKKANVPDKSKSYSMKQETCLRRLNGYDDNNGLGQNISFDLYLQNYEQLDDLYGESIAETIKGNCGNHFYLQTASKETARNFLTV